jgi:cAMP-specific phosphodiesterase 4/calcium/calmodulin-dependent 3',5'-cyclic nucleotide phosphodiesterase
MYLFEQNDLISYFEMDREKLERFLFIIEQGYPVQNRYHNRSHAASVVHLMHAILTLGSVGEAAAIAADAVVDHDRRCKFTILAGLLAAIVHDYQHEGVNNDFLVKSSSQKAILYNDRSPNENHHVAAAWFVLRRADCNFLENLTVKEYRQVRSLVLDLVLSTDMADHGNKLNSFKEIVKVASMTPAAVPGADLALTSVQDATITLQIALKCADLGHLSLCWSSHMRWVQRLEEEFFAQGDKEMKQGMPDVSFLMDRSKPGASDSQVGFFDFVVLPLFQEFGAAFPATRPMLSAVEANYEQWKAVQSESSAAH